MKKESFLIYKEWYPIISHLTDESLGSLFRAIFEYQDGKEPELDPTSPEFMAFQFFRNQFDRDLAKYEDRCKKNKENIRKRWNTTEYDRKESNTNNTDNVKDNEKEKEKDKVKENDKENELIFPFPDSFRSAWIGWLDYKKEQHRFKYKSVKSEQIAINQLYEISEGDPGEAYKIIELAIANGWKGLFKRKEADKKQKKSDTFNHLEDIKSRLS